MNPDGTWPLVSAHQMRALDSYTIEEAHVSADVLMESAGRAVVDALLSRFVALLREPRAEVLVVCGRGNNGGDGLVVARHLHLLGVRVRAVLVGDRKNLSRGNRPELETRGGHGRAAVHGTRPCARGRPGGGCPVRHGPVSQARRRSRRVGRSHQSASSERLQIVSIDIPSGIHADTGRSWVAQWRRTSP